MRVRHTPHYQATNGVCRVVGAGLPRSPAGRLVGPGMLRWVRWRKLRAPAACRCSTSPLVRRERFDERCERFRTLGEPGSPELCDELPALPLRLSPCRRPLATAAARALSTAPPWAPSPSGRSAPGPARSNPKGGEPSHGDTGPDRYRQPSCMHVDVGLLSPRTTVRVRAGRRRPGSSADLVLTTRRGSGSGVSLRHAIPASADREAPERSASDRRDPCAGPVVR